MSLASALESAAAALPKAEAVIRPANGDPRRVLDGLDGDAAREVLAWLVEHDASAGEELLASWIEDERGAALLAEVDPAPFSKAARKVLRRARHRLRSRGVEVSEPTAEVTATLPELEDSLGGAFLSFPDPSGAQMALRVEPRAGGGARILHAVFDFERGVLEFRAHDANRSQGRRLLRELGQSGQSGQGGFAAISPEAWAALLVRAAEAQPEDRPLPMAYAESRARWDATAEIPAAQGGADDGDDADGAAIRRGVEWVQEGRLGPWPPRRAELEAAGERVRQALQSRLLVDDNQRRRQVDSVLGDAADERYAGEAAERTAQRFDTAAFVLAASGTAEDAAVCVACARAFRSTPPRDNPVARALLGRSLEPLMREWQEEEAASLLVRP